MRASSVLTAIVAFVVLGFPASPESKGGWDIDLGGCEIASVRSVDSDRPELRYFRDGRLVMTAPLDPDGRESSRTIYRRFADGLDAGTETWHRSGDEWHPAFGSTCERTDLDDRIVLLYFEHARLYGIEPWLKYEATYRKNLVIARWRFYESGKEFRVIDYDEKGNPVSETGLDRDTKKPVDFRYANAYDGSGRLVRVTATSFGATWSVTGIEYAPDGSLVTTTYESPSQGIHRRTTETFADGRKISSETVDFRSGAVESRTWTYDAWGRLFKEKQVVGSTTLIWTWEWLTPPRA